MKKYTIREASPILHKAVRTIRWWIHTGKIEAEKPIGTNRWLISESEIERKRIKKDD